MDKVFIVVFMLVAPIDDDMMIVENPTFSNVLECRTYVAQNWRPLTVWLKKEFGGAAIKNIYCFPQSMLDKFNKFNQGVKT